MLLTNILNCNRTITAQEQEIKLYEIERTENTDELQDTKIRYSMILYYSANVEEEDFIQITLNSSMEKNDWAQDYYITYFHVGKKMKRMETFTIMIDYVETILIANRPIIRKSNEIFYEFYIFEISDAETQISLLLADAIEFEVDNKTIIVPQNGVQAIGQMFSGEIILKEHGIDPDS
jgi:hypothetical protein